MNDDFPIVPRPAGGLVAGNSREALERLAPKVAEAHRTRLGSEKAERTMRAYVGHRKTWAAWCVAQGLRPFPATVPMVLAFLHDLEPALAKARGEEGRLSISSVRARLAAIAYYQKQYNDPVEAPPVTRSADVVGLMSALSKKYGVPQDAKRPLVQSLLWDVITTLPDTLAGHRDRALLLLGMLGAMRRSEISALTVETVRAVEDPQGLEITIWRSKTDQTARGHVIGIVTTHTELCAADALVKWLDESGIETGPIFWPVTQHGKMDRRHGPLTGHGIALVVKRHAARVGLDASEFSGHSLRSGFVTEAADQGATVLDIANHTRHTNLDTLRKYLRRATLFHPGNPTSKIAQRPRSR